MICKKAKALIQQKVRSFLGSFGDQPCLILDTRARPLYRARHLAPSANIPYDRLHRSLFQLPPRQTPFAVLESQGQRDDTILGRGSFGGAPRPSEVIRSRGWKPEWVFEDHQLFWETIAEEIQADQKMKIIEGDIHGTGDRTRYNFLFKPNPALVKALPFIERELVALRSNTLRSTSAKPTLLRCLDVGCGSGRDMTYMVARSANGVAIDGAEWSALGMDQREDMCELARQLAKDVFLEDDDGSDTNTILAARVNTLVGKVDPISGTFRISSPPSQTGRPLPVHLPNIRFADDSLDQQYQRVLSESPTVATKDKFDLVVMIRFLQRSLLKPLVEHWLRPGGFILINTFVSDCDLPEYAKPGPSHRLQSKSEARDILEVLGLEVVMEEISFIEDGARSAAMVLARKPRHRE